MSASKAHDTHAKLAFDPSLHFVTNMSLNRPDALSRDPLLAALQQHVDSLASVSLEVLTSPRVIAIDAPWGSGKSWIALKLQERLSSSDHKVAMIDAFRYDHHDDAFAVLAASIMDTLRPKADQKKRYITAVGAVMKAGTPVLKALLKGGTDLALGAVGVDLSQLGEVVDSVRDAAVDGAVAVSEKAIESVLERYASTQRIQDEFVSVLSSMTKQLDKPLVVIVDELDRCRPTFALEILERIKHLFAADNVVFLLFWNGASIRESIRHTYGQGTDSLLYLSKFIAYTVPIPMQTRDMRRFRTRFHKYIEVSLSEKMVGVADLPQGADFAYALSEFAEAFDASIRDVSRAMDLLRCLVLTEVRARSPAALAYAVLLSATNHHRFLRLVGRDPAFFAEEAIRLADVGQSNKQGNCAYMWLIASYLAEQEKYDTAFANRDAVAITGVHAEILEAVYGYDSRPQGHIPVFQAAVALYECLSGTRLPLTYT